MTNQILVKDRRTGVIIDRAPSEEIIKMRADDYRHLYNLNEYEDLREYIDVQKEN